MRLSHLLLAVSMIGTCFAQQAPATPHRMRLILKDGTYQIVMSYSVKGSTVSYVSAERAGQIEEIPLDLVDLQATKLWEQRHVAGAEVSTHDSVRPAPVLDPELAKE